MEDDDNGRLLRLEIAHLKKEIEDSNNRYLRDCEKNEKQMQVLEDALRTAEKLITQLQERSTLAQAGQAGLSIVLSTIAVVLMWLITKGGG